MKNRILIAGFGNPLRWDDGFGIEVVRRLLAILSQDDLLNGVKVMEVGISGISLVQELMNKYQALILIDAVDKGETPGTIYQIVPRVEDLSSLDLEARHEFLGDMHYVEPSRAMVMAQALGVLPEKIILLGCQPGIVEELGIGLSPPVKKAVKETAESVSTIVRKWTAQDFAALEFDGD